MPTLEEVKQKVKEELGSLKMTELNFSNYSSALNDPYNAFFWSGECESIDEYFQELFSIPLILNENNKDEEKYPSVFEKRKITFGEVRQRLYKNIGKLVNIFRRGMDENFKYLEEKIDYFNKNCLCRPSETLQEQLKTIESYYKSFFSPFKKVGGIFNSRRTFEMVVYEANYGGARDKLDEFTKKVEQRAWEIVGFSEPREIQKLRQNFYTEQGGSSICNLFYKYWPEKFFPQKKIVNKTYNGFDPLKFTFQEIDEKLIKGGYQPSDLDARGKYISRNPLEKSKVDWDKFLSQNNGTSTSSEFPSSDPGTNETTTPPPNNESNPPSNNDKNEEEKIINLLRQVREKNTYEELAAIIGELKKHRSTNAYQKHEQEINQLEVRLKNLDSGKYQDTVNEFLDEQIKNSGLIYEELSAGTKEIIEEAKNAGDPNKVKVVEESLIKERSKKELNDIINSIKKFLNRKDKTEQERENLIKQLSWFIIRDIYAKDVYQLQKQEVDRVFAELRGQNNHQNQSHQNFFSSPAFSLCLIGLFLGIVIIGALVIKNKRRKGTKK